MNHKTYAQVLKDNWQKLAIGILGLVVLSLVFSLVQPFEYRSRTELLVVQKQSAVLDAYAAARAAERLASNFAVAVKTRSFLEKVLTGNFGISKRNFPTEESKLRKYWQDKVATKVYPETSILSVDIFDKNKEQANRIATGVAYILVNQSAEYYGGGEGIAIRVVNEPLVSNRPVKPNIILNVVLATVIGLVLSAAWVVYEINKKLGQKIGNEDSPAYQTDRQVNQFNQEFNFEDNEGLRKEKVKNIFAPQIMTMYDNLADLNGNEEI